MKRALVTGVAGQDGRYLSKYLSELGYEVWGIDVQPPRVGVADVYETVDLLDKDALFKFLDRSKPDEIYHLAAHHHAAVSIPQDNYALFKKSYEIQVFSTLNLLTWIHAYSQSSRMFYASSCHIFGEPREGVQNENTLYSPVCAYGITKLSGMNLCKYFREKHKVFVACGILFNHESPLRSAQFVTQKIVHAVKNIKCGNQSNVMLGNLYSVRDWGYAADFVRAMHAIMQLDYADEYVISTGEAHTVKDFVHEAFKYAGMEWNDYVILNTSLSGEKSQIHYVGDSSKLRAATGWKPYVDFKGLVHLMIDEGLRGSNAE
jgi:GDPmannose 4,6-dehydratase